MKRNSEEQNEIVKEALERFETASDGWSDIYEQSVADVSFIDDDEGQWEDSVRESRHNRPCLTFDKLLAARWHKCPQSKSEPQRKAMRP